MPQNDLELAFKCLKAKRNDHLHYYEYYEGNSPQPFLTERLREIFRGKQTGLIDIRENWSSFVIDAVADRITLKGFALQSNWQPYQEALDLLWQETELKLEADDVQKDALICGEGYLFMWKPDPASPATEIEVYTNQPWLADIVYDPSSPRKALYGVKCWDAETKDEYGDPGARLNLYYPDHIEYYASNKKITDSTDPKGFELQDTALNPYGEIPIFHFRTDRRCVRSDLASVIPIQDAVDLLNLNLLVASEFAALPHKWVVSNADFGEPIRNAPGIILQLPAAETGMQEQTQVGQFAAADLENYNKAIDTKLSHLAAISRVPKHYLLQQGGDPSGEALMTMEAPLVKKALDRIDRFSVTWQQVARFLLKLAGVPDQDLPPLSAIKPIFERPETVQPVTQATVRLNEVKSGIPLEVALKREGWSQQELDDLEQAKQDANQPQQQADTTAMGPDMSNGSNLQNLKGNQFDLEFIRQMIPHHQAAIAMAELAPDRAGHSEIRTLAKNIIKTQTSEIQQMQQWQQDWQATPQSQDATGQLRM